MFSESKPQYPTAVELVRAHLCVQEILAIPKHHLKQHWHRRTEYKKAATTLARVSAQSLHRLLDCCEWAMRKQGCDLVAAAEWLEKEWAKSEPPEVVAKRLAEMYAKHERKLHGILGDNCPATQRRLFEALYSEKGKALAEWQLIEITFRVVVDDPGDLEHIRAFRRAFGVKIDWRESNLFVGTIDLNERNRLTVQFRKLVTRLVHRLMKRKSAYSIVRDDESLLRLIGPGCEQGERWTVEDCKNLLCIVLQHYGSVPTKELQQNFLDRKCKRTTFRKACEQLKVVHSRIGFGPKSVCKVSLPPKR